LVQLVNGQDRVIGAGIFLMAVSSSKQFAEHLFNAASVQKMHCSDAGLVLCGVRFSSCQFNVMERQWWRCTARALC